MFLGFGFLGLEGFDESAEFGEVWFEFDWASGVGDDEGLV